MCTGTYRRSGLKNRSKDTYVLDRWPKTDVVEYFLCIASAKYTRTSAPARNISLFFSIIIRISLLLLYSNLHKKIGTQFPQNNFLYKCLFKIPLWDKIDKATFCFLFSNKNLKWKQYFHIDAFCNYILLNMAVCWG